MTALRALSIRPAIPLLPAACCLALSGPGAARSQLPLPPRAPVTQMEMGFDFSQGLVRLDVDFGSARAARMVLDTGNISSTLDIDTAKSLGLAFDPDQKKKMGTEADAPEYYRLTPERVRLGSETFTGNVFAAAPLSKRLADTYGITCDGTLGYGFFKGRVLQIDYPARKLRLLASAPAATATAAPVPIAWRPYQKGTPPLVTVDRLRIGNRAVAAQVDTFFTGSLILFPGKLAGLEMTAAKDVPATYYAQARLSAGRLKEAVALAGSTYPAGGVLYVASKEAHTPQTEIAAILGNAFFQDAVVTLDLKNSQLIVNPGHGGPQSDFPLRPTGTAQ